MLIVWRNVTLVFVVAWTILKYVITLPNPLALYITLPQYFESFYTLDSLQVPILENTRYIFLYKSPESIIEFRRQWTVGLCTETYDIMGAVATSGNLIFPFKDKLYRRNIYVADDDVVSWIAEIISLCTVATFRNILNQLFNINRNVDRLSYWRFISVEVNRL
jgi:hypothetical protein